MVFSLRNELIENNKYQERVEIMEKFYYERPSINRKKEAIEYVKEFNGTLVVSGGLKNNLDNYENWLIRINDEREGKIPNVVPTENFYLIRKSDNRIVGSSNIRLKLDDNLRNIGGHIGYSIRPSERRKGYNKINLYLALKVLKEYKIDYAYLDCLDINIGSYKTMEALGGVLIEKKEKEHNGQFDLWRKYCLNVNKCLEDNKDKMLQFLA